MVFFEAMVTKPVDAAPGVSTAKAESSAPAELAFPASSRRRVLFDYDSTLNPGQGNAPLTPDRAAMLGGFIARWRAAAAAAGGTLEVCVLTASSPEVKTAALEAAGIRAHFDEVLSSSMPKKFASKGEYIARRVRKEGWDPRATLLADDSIEAVQSCFEDDDGAREGGAIASTLRLPQHSREGLLEEDMRLIEARFLMRPESALEHWHSYRLADGARHVDANDSAMKCMLDALPANERANIFAGNMKDGVASEHLAQWCDGRPDFAAASNAAK